MELVYDAFNISVPLTGLGNGLQDDFFDGSKCELVEDARSFIILDPLDGLPRKQIGGSLLSK